LLLAAPLFGARAYGQGGATGAIGGVVVDTTGASVSGAEVQIINASMESVVRKLSTDSGFPFPRFASRNAVSRRSAFLGERSRYSVSVIAFRLLAVAFPIFLIVSSYSVSS